MQIDIVTLFPGMFEGVLRESMVRIAQEKGLVRFACHNLRDYTLDKHRKVDSPPYGGGAGMVLQAEPVFRAVEDLRSRGRADATLVLLTPQGEVLNQRIAGELSRAPGLILLCGHYEGFDERVIEGLRPREISIGDYVLSGGEIPAMVILDAVVRLVPGVLGDPASAQEESFSAGVLEYPQYTRPREFRGMTVPDVLLSGHHQAIRAWREEQARARTLARRKDLMETPAPKRRATPPGKPETKTAKRRAPAGARRKTRRNP
jgi:tRNA (guanine37-N1)-methyltransferase